MPSADDYSREKNPREPIRLAKFNCKEYALHKQPLFLIRTAIVRTHLSILRIRDRLYPLFLLHRFALTLHWQKVHMRQHRQMILRNTGSFHFSLRATCGILPEINR